MINVLYNALKLDEGPSHNLAGNFRHCLELAIELSRNERVRLSVLCDEYTRSAFSDQLDNTDIHYCPLSGGGVIAADIAVTRMVKKLKPDVYHRAGGQLPMWPLPCPSIATIADLNFLYLPTTKLKWLYKKISYRMTVRMAAHVTCISDYTRNDLIQKLGAKPCRVSTVHLGANRLPTPDFGISDIAGPSFWVTFGHQAHKNVESVLRALARRPEDERLIVIGESRNIDLKLRPLAQSLGIGQRVDFAGRVSAAELHGLLLRASGGFGLPILESMQAGCPVICSNVCSIPEVAGDAAILQSPMDVEAAVSAMQRLREDQDLRMHLIEKGFERIKKFTWEEAAAQTVAVYRRAVNVNRSSF